MGWREQPGTAIEPLEGPVNMGISAIAYDKLDGRHQEQGHTKSFMSAMSPFCNRIKRELSAMRSMLGRPSGNILADPRPLMVVAVLFILMFASLLILIPTHGFGFWNWWSLYGCLISTCLYGAITIGNVFCAFASTPIGRYLSAAVAALLLWVCHAASRWTIGEIVGDNPSGFGNSVVVGTVLLATVVICLFGIVGSFVIIMRDLLWRLWCSATMSDHRHETRTAACIAMTIVFLITLWIIKAQLLDPRGAISEMIVLLDFQEHHPFEHIPDDARIAYVDGHCCIARRCGIDSREWRFESRICTIPELGSATRSQDQAGLGP